MTAKYREVTDGIVTGGFTDWHVHTALIDTDALRGGPLTRVWDLGANPDNIVDLAAVHAVSDDLPDIRYAGPFLTAPGGYPSDREWAPAGSVHEVTDPTLALHAVRFLVGEDAGCIKVMLHTHAGPTPSDAVVRAIVREASLHGVPVVIHAEGEGQARRARKLGATALAHTPFTERLSDDEIRKQAAAVTWVSTLAIHRSDDGNPTAAYTTAVENLRRFHAAGGRTLYGTDMGNGPTPVGIHPGEIESLRDAGFSSGEILAALTPGRLTQPGDDSGRMIPQLFIPGSIDNLLFTNAERITND